MMLMNIKNQLKRLTGLSFLGASLTFAEQGIVVFQSDFGIRDGAVSEVKGVMYSVDKTLLISDLTNEIEPYNIWQASYRLYQTAPYWPEKTVFVSVVDPGVGTKRHSVVAFSKNNQYFVTPDNGTLTFIAEHYGIKEVRIINEKKNRLKGSLDSYTFHGRDVYGYTAAKLASGAISFAEVGPVLKEEVVKLPYRKAVIKDNKIYGTLVSLDPNYGNVWTNIDKELLKSYSVENGKSYRVSIVHNNKEHYSGTLNFYNTFGETEKKTDLLYVNSMLNLSLATNQGSFAQRYNIGTGPGWSITLQALK
jgi:S-adenosylmethionine hydrolase